MGEEDDELVVLFQDFLWWGKAARIISFMQCTYIQGHVQGFKTGVVLISYHIDIITPRLTFTFLFGAMII